MRGHFPDWPLLGMTQNLLTWRFGQGRKLNRPTTLPKDTSLVKYLSITDRCCAADGLVREMAGPTAQHRAVRQVKNWTNSFELGQNPVEEFPWSHSRVKVSKAASWLLSMFLVHMTSNSHRMNNNQSKNPQRWSDWHTLQMIHNDQLTEVHMYCGKVQGHVQIP